jgi:hypothetical protein
MKLSRLTREVIWFGVALVVIVIVFRAYLSFLGD